MNHGEKNEIRSIAEREWYWISRAILKRYGRILKSSGLAVYNVLASYANSKSQTCFPTQKSIAKLLGISVRTVNRKVQLFKVFKLIRVKKTRGRCFYSLLRVDMPKETRQYDKRDIRVRTPGKPNNNNLIKINNKNNNGNEKINNLRPISRFLKRYGQRISKNNRH